MSENIPYRYIAIEGNIGAGKTSVVNLLARALGARTLFETFENNPFLPQFYQDAGSNAFPLEMFFLAERYRQLSSVQPGQQDIFSELVISDYFVSKSAIFAGFNLSDKEWDLFIRFFEIVEKNSPLPDLVVFLHRDLAYLQKHIGMRGRGYEQYIEAGYLERVSQGYHSFFRSEKRFPVVVVDCGEVDFYENGQINYLMDKVLRKKWGKSLHFIDFKAGMAN